MIKKNDINSIINKKCAPSKKFTDKSCFSLESLIKIANKYNEINSDKIDIKLSKELLVNELELKLSNDCSNQSCWTRLQIIEELDDNDILNNTFRPDGPPKKYDWLSTTNIDEVLKQYQYVHANFIFLGAVPYDFDEINILGINNLNFKKLEDEGKTKIGIVINLDNHNQNGSHWVSLYFDLNNYEIYFYDSVGKQPGKKIKLFINKIVKYLYYKKYNTKLQLYDIYKQIKIYYNTQSDKINKLLKKNQNIYNLITYFDIRYNSKQNQFKNSECGVYSINFILRLLNGESFDFITNTLINDDDMNNYRNLYFSNVNYHINKN